MNDWYRDDSEGSEEGPLEKSKTQVKKEMHALQKLGEDMMQLNKEQLATIPLPDNLRMAIEQAQGMKKEARRRQLQYIGKLMRNTEIDAVQNAYDGIREKQNRNARALHLVEQWRDNLIQGDDKAITDFVTAFPDADRQQLRQLVRGAKQEVSQQKPPAQARKLFKFIRDLAEI